ncbi:MAG: T9SS type A sorting domain-containing protein [Prevotella sp.]|nr:T9SS type A sorting domain-containing protein [Prevotella sp.]
MLQRKFYILLFAVLSVFGKANAANTGDALIVEFNDDSQAEEYFYLAEKPEVEFGADVVYIKSSSFTTEFDYSSIKRIYFGDDSKPSDTPGPVTDIANEPTPNRFTFEYVDGQTVRMTGVDEAMQVALYSIDGKRMSTDAERNGDEVTIHLAGLQHGFYIIKTNKQSFKIYKK